MHPEINKPKLGDGAAGDLAIVRPAAAAPPRRPEPVEQHRAAETNKPKLRRARSSAPTRQGIKRTSPKGRRESTPEPPMLFWRDPSRCQARSELRGER